MEGEGYYPFEKLEVYQLAMEFRRMAKKIIERVPQADAGDIDQLNRSTKSTVRNICEGAGEFRPREKARFYRMAIRSVTESGGSLRLLELDHGSNESYAEAHHINYRLLAKLIVLSNRKRNS